MAFLDDSVYTIKSGPFDHIQPEIELDGADIAEIIKEDITDRIELFPEYAYQLQENNKIAITHALGATFDASLLLGIDKEMATSIMNKGIELLKERKLY